MNILCCPCCGVILDKMPKARRKCPDCREWIYPKKPYKGEHKILMTKAQADEVNRQWDEYHERQACGGLPLDQWHTSILT